MHFMSISNLVYKTNGGTVLFFSRFNGIDNVFNKLKRLIRFNHLSSFGL